MDLSREAKSTKDHLFSNRCQDVRCVVIHYEIVCLYLAEGNYNLYDLGFILL